MDKNKKTNRQIKKLEEAINGTKIEIELCLIYSPTEIKRQKKLKTKLEKQNQKLEDLIFTTLSTEEQITRLEDKIIELKEREIGLNNLGIIFFSPKGKIMFEDEIKEFERQRDLLKMIQAIPQATKNKKTKI